MRVSGMLIAAYLLTAALFAGLALGILAIAGIDALQGSFSYVGNYWIILAGGLLTVAHLNLGIETYDPDVYFARVQSGPVGGYDTSAVDRIRARWERSRPSRQQASAARSRS